MDMALGHWAGSAAAPLLTDPAILLIATWCIIPQPRVQHHDTVLTSSGIVGLSRVPVTVVVQWGSVTGNLGW